MVISVPYNISSQVAAKNARAEFEDFMEVIRSSLYLKLWNGFKENRFPAPAKEFLDTSNAPIKQIGRIMLDLGYLTQEQLDKVLDLQSMLIKLGSFQQLGQLIVSSGYVSQKQLDEILKNQERTYRLQKQTVLKA